MQRTFRTSGLAVFAALSAVSVHPQSPCPATEFAVGGQVLDTSGALVPGAVVTVDGGSAEFQSDREGRFRTACLTSGSHTLKIEAASFEPAVVPVKTMGGTQTITVRLLPSTVQAEVTAVAEDGVSSEDLAGSRTLATDDVAQLADDPDEFSRQLQVLAAAAGGAPGQATVTVDGFQNGGQIPPKSSIALIRVNPDLFSAEYARPPYQGGRVEIYTKPGQSKLHGALFTTQSFADVNAKDPFSPGRAPLGKQRYGAELSGPILRNRSDFALALEHREIDRFAVVDAVTLDGSGTPQKISANVAAPQSLWEASARLGLLLSPKNNVTVSYTANVSELTSQGVDGTVLPEAGFNSLQSEHVLHASDLETLSAQLVHETRVGYTWRYRTDTPNSTAPSLEVAGSFTGGGAPTGFLRSHERDLEVDDDVLYSRGKHSLKAGLELIDASLHDTLPSDFNGTYVFGGGAGANNTVLTGLEQYQRAVRNQPGGTPTQFDVSTGTGEVSLNQLQAVLYAQDQWKLRPRLQLSLGVRWAMQNTPVTVGNAGPRLGVAWSPDGKQKTVFHARTGLFFGPIDAQTALTDLQLNGAVQRQLQVNNAAYQASFATGMPLPAGTSTITALRAPLPALTQSPSLQSHLGLEHDFPKHWHAQANLYLVHGWDLLRSRDTNAPIDGTVAGPRPIEPNTNLYQFQQTGRIGGNVLFAGLDQHSLKHLQIFAGYIRMDLRGDADAATEFPQNGASDAGEIARPAWESTHHLIAFANYALPKAMSLAMQFDAASGVPYDVTTGFDDNGDGVFNDRPAFRTDANTSTSYPTRFGLLSPTGTGPTLGRNAGTLPWNVHLDLNLSRTFALHHRPGKDGQTLVANLRSTNVLNHTNVTAVGGVLGSPLFGQPYLADPGRRVEAGLRWSF